MNTMRVSALVAMMLIHRTRGGAFGDNWICLRTIRQNRDAYLLPTGAKLTFRPANGDGYWVIYGYAIDCSDLFGLSKYLEKPAKI